MAAAAKHQGQVVDGLPDVQDGAEAAEENSFRFKAILAKKKKKKRCNLEEV